jgi:hypothetical protein
LAFGHHLLVALQDRHNEYADIIVSNFTNEQTFRMIVNENIEEWFSSAWIELETVRAVIEAYGNGDFELRSSGSSGDREFAGAVVWDGTSRDPGTAKEFIDQSSGRLDWNVGPPRRLSHRRKS